MTVGRSRFTTVNIQQAQAARGTEGRVGLGRSARSRGRGRVRGDGDVFIIIPVSIVAIRQSGCNISTHHGRHWVAGVKEHFPRGSVGIGDATGEAGTVAGAIASTFGHS